MAALSVDCLIQLCISEKGELSGGSRTAATSEMELFVMPLNIITKSPIMNVATVLDPPLELMFLT